MSDGELAGLTPFHLAQLAHITIAEATEALAIFLAPDENSGNSIYEGRRLQLINKDTNTYRMVTFETHDALIRKAKEAARKRIEYATEKSGESGESPKPSAKSTTALHCTTLQEKKETPSESRKKTRTIKTALSNTWSPSDETRTAAAERFPSVNFDTQLAAFKDHHTAKASTFANWDRALLVWLSRAATQFASRETNAEQQLHAGAPAPLDKAKEKAELAQIEANALKHKEEGKMRWQAVRKTWNSEPWNSKPVPTGPWNAEHQKFLQIIGVTPQTFVSLQKEFSDD